MSKWLLAIVLLILSATVAWFSRDVGDSHNDVAVRALASATFWLIVIAWENLDKGRR